MPTRAIELFVDTNAFIQLRDLKDLPWTELVQDAVAIDILVNHTVIDELDRLKSSTNDRRRNRARLALKMINAASEAHDFGLVLLNAPVCLRLVIVTGPIPDWASHPKLDRHRADDQLVADVLSFGRGAALLSHDSGPRIRARTMGIRTYEPPDTWLLPDERTDDQRKIAQLERMLDKALSDRPRILVSLGTLEDPQERFNLTIPILSPLPASVQTRLVAAYLDLHPPKRRAENRDISSLIRPLGDSPGSYNRKLDRFEKDVASFFASLHRTIFQTGQIAPVPYAIRNDSNVSAQGLRIEMQVDGAAFLFADQEDAKSFFDILAAPKLPKFDDGFDAFAHIHRANALSQALSQPRDPTAFYWFTRPRYDVEGALQCADFRATRLWESDLWICAESKEPFNVALDVSATNLPSPVVRTLSISMEEKEVAWSDEVIKDLLPKDIWSLVQRSL
jgi:hypothetical protein